MIETRRIERAALSLVSEATRHFGPSAMQILDHGVADGHRALRQLLDRNRFIGIRVFDRDTRLAYETWADGAANLAESTALHTHAWPAADLVHRNRIRFADEELIQVVLPLTAKDGVLLGYLEGIYRLDQEALRHQRDQLRNSVLTVAASVLTTAVLLYPLLLEMLRRSTRLANRLLESNLALVRSLGNAVAKRDTDTDGHSYRVTLYAVALAEAMRVPEREISDLVIGAFLHDVGKIGIPDYILRKHGKLSSDEFELMKKHVRLGLDIVEGNSWMEGAALVIGHHHEWFNGRGYPQGLRGEAIARNARIFAVVDVFDALTSARPYKAPMSFSEALPIIERGAGQQFDPEVILSFTKIAPDLHDRITWATDGALRREMHSILLRYFKTKATTERSDLIAVSISK